jgi:hypothetical protein
VTVTDETITPPARLTPTQRLHEITLAALHRTPVKASEEIEVTRNAKGDYQFRVAGVAGEDESLARVAARVLSIARDLDNVLPLSRAQYYARDIPDEAAIAKARTKAVNKIAGTTADAVEKSVKAEGKQ